MPAKNSIKLYAENGYYHIYNRGVAKTDIFLNQQDYGVFLSYLKEYLSPPKPLTPKDLSAGRQNYLLNNYHDQVRLLAFCLMPNHFHLLVNQRESHTIESLMRSLSIRFSSYFNKKYARVGHLFQSVYKAILIQSDDYLLWLSRYIHRNPIELLSPGQKLSDYPYSSYRSYLGFSSTRWLDTNEIKARTRDYTSFVEENTNHPPENFPEVILEEDTI